jgi:hypothetical protein
MDVIDVRERKWSTERPQPCRYIENPLAFQILLTYTSFPAHSRELSI